VRRSRLPASAEKFAADDRVRRESLVTDSAFFDRFRSSRPLREAICAKIFFTAHVPVAISINEKCDAYARCFRFMHRVQNKMRSVQEILISSHFFEICVSLARCAVGYFFGAAALRIGAPLLRQDATRTRAIHTSLSGTLFFSLCCSKRNAVRVDSRPH
jgi:hypothetical protein